MLMENAAKKENNERYPGVPAPEWDGKYWNSSEFGIHTELSEFPVSGCPAYMTGAVGGVCVSGSATLTVFNVKFRIRPDMIIILLPWQLVSIHEVSGDFRVSFFRMSEEMFTDSLSSLWRQTTEFFFYMSKHIAFEPLEGTVRRFANYCDLLQHRTVTVPEICRRESVMQLLRVFFWDCYTSYITSPDPHNKKFHYTLKEELAYRFLHMVLADHSPDKDVAYYAGKLGVSAKYLTTVVRSLSGHSARDWIVRYMLLEIKSLLRESSMDLKTIAARTRFPDQSAMSRFFRHYTGTTPSVYRKKIFL